MAIRNKTINDVYKKTQFNKSNFTKQFSLAIIVLFVNSFAGYVKQFYRIPKLLFALCILWVGTINAYGQSDITIGTGTTNANIPIYPYFGYTYSQSIYLQSELGGPKTITTVSFYYGNYSGGLGSSNTWVIYIGHTTKTGITSTSDWVPLSSLTQVYSGTFTSPTSTGWITFDITDFAYNGTDNLVIAVDENSSGYNTSSDYFHSTTSTYNSIYYYNDVTNPDPASPPTGTLTLNRPNIKIAYASSCTPSFSSFTDYITNFSLGSINNSTGFSTGGYGNYTGQSTNLNAGSTVNASLTSSSGSGTHAVAIWIDFDNNGDFATSERVGTMDAIGPSVTVSIPITIPSSASAGSHKMRVVYQYNVTATNISPCASASYGEGEDYTVNISSCTTPGTPTSLSGSGTSTTTASLSWAAGSPAGSATVTYYWTLYTSGGTLITSGNTTGTSATASSLSCGTSYYFTVYATTSCNSTSSSTATSGTFSTSACSPAAALNFDGTNDLVILSNSPTVSAPYTIEFWAKPESTTTGSVIGSRSGGSGNTTFDVKFSGGSTIHGDIGDGTSWLTITADASLSYSTGTWYHIAYVVTTTGYTIYINGTQSATGTFSGTPLLCNSSNKLAIGAYCTGGGEYFDGDVDELRIWNYARSQSQIQGNMNCEMTSQSGLVALYYFNQGNAFGSNAAVNTLIDASGNSYTGSLTNFTLTGSSSNWVAPGGVTTGNTCVTEMIVPSSGNNSYTVCSGNLYDYGGSAGDYSNSTDGYTVLYPATAGNKIQISGTSSGEACCDYLQIYNGVGTGALIGTYNMGTDVTAITSTDASGALTIKFHSDVSVIGAGFNLSISCVAPCTTPGTPTSLSGSGTSTTTASLSWAAGSPAGSASVTYYWKVYTSGGSLVTSGNTTGTSATTGGLLCGTAYYFTVYAYTSCNGTQSATATSGSFTPSGCVVTSVDWSWARRQVNYSGNTNACVWPKNLATDATDNIISCGYYTGTQSDRVSFDGQLASGYSTGSFIYTGYVAKYNSAGTIQWLKRIGSESDVEVKGVCADASGNVYAVGSFANTTRFGDLTLTGSGSGGTTVPSVYGSDGFIIKYKSDGTFEWVKVIAASSTPQGSKSAEGIRVTSDAIYVVGTFSGKVNFDGSHSLTSTLDGSTSSDDIFLAKYDLSGNVVWVQKAGGMETDYGLGINTDASGNIFINGSFASTATFGSINVTCGGGAGSTTQNIYLAKYNSSGTCQWVKYGASTSSMSYGSNSPQIAIDDNNDVYLAGCLPASATVNFGTSVTNASASVASMFVTKINNAGAHSWTKQFTSTGGVTGSCIAARGLYVMTGGQFTGNGSFGIYTPTSTGSSSDFFIKIDGADGSVVPLVGFNGAIAGGIGITSYDPNVCVDNSGNLVVGGLAYGSSSAMIFSPYSIINHLSTGYIAKIGTNLLPVELIKFDAVCSNNTVELNWSTATETNNDYFTIERSTDAITWETTGTVNGAGNSNSVQYYQFADQEPLPDYTYYRLRQTDYDGSKEVFSPVVLSCFAGSPMVSVYPNPFDQELIIEFNNLSEPLIEVMIRDITGRLLLSQTFTAVSFLQSKITLNLTGIAKGVYAIEIKTGDFSIIKKVIKE